MKDQETNRARQHYYQAYDCLKAAKNLLSQATAIRVLMLNKNKLIKKYTSDNLALDEMEQLTKDSVDYIEKALKHLGW